MHRFFAVACVAVLVSAVPLAAQTLPPIHYEKFVLSNGLQVILHEDHATPIVAVNVWYHVGSKNELHGRTGFAHLFEHMMFQGSKHHNTGYFRPLQEVGASLNGSTNVDRTNYWEVVPSNFLELALWLESDRMGWLLDALTDERLANQRDVVKNERRQNYENRPYGQAVRVLREALYPSDHPYSWLTIGSQEDLTAATKQDVMDFFRSYYTPSNASLCIAGDFNPQQARELVKKYFGEIPAGPPVARLKHWVPELAAEKRAVMEDRVELPRVYLAWHTVPGFEPDDAELDILAHILGEGKASRLYEKLVYEEQIAQDIAAFQNSMEIAGYFEIQATAKPGHSPAELEAAILKELARIQKEAPKPEEVERAKNSYEAQFVNGLQSVGGFGGKSDRLNQYNVMVGDPGYFEKDLQRYLKVTPGDVQRVARHYLTDRRVVLHAVPKAKGASAAEMEKPDRDHQPLPGPPPAFRLPPIERRTLANGLSLVVVEHHELPVVRMTLVARAGAAADPPDRAGLASFVAAMLEDGTKKRSALDIASQLDFIGASLHIATESDSNQLSLQTLKRHWSTALDIYADIVTGSTFPPAEFERERKTRLTQLIELRDSPARLAERVFPAVLYGAAHPYGHSELGTESSLRVSTRDELEKFYRSHYRPNECTLIVVGDTTLDEAAKKIEASFHDWQKGEAPITKLPAAEQHGSTKVYLVDKPGAAQSVIYAGWVGTDRATPDYYPLLVTHTLLGGMFMSRINLNLREDKGYSYGARTFLDLRLGPGPFYSVAPVQTAVTYEAVRELLKEMRGVRGERPVTAAELEYAKNAVIRGFPRTFETPTQISNHLVELVVYNLPDNSFNDYMSRVEAVTLDDVNRVAQRYIVPDRLTIVVVGDRATIENKLKQLALPIVVVDAEGRPVS